MFQALGPRCKSRGSSRGFRSTMLEAAKIIGLFWVAMILTYVLRMLRRPGGGR
jgi:hypothetical protein